MRSRSPTLKRPNKVSTVLFGQTRRRVLGWLFSHPDEAFNLPELVRRTGAARKPVQRELAALTSAGLLQRRSRGRQIYFQPNRVAPVFRELHGLIVKTVGVVEVLQEALMPIAGEIALAFLFGSAARGSLHRTSDVDLLVVGDGSFTILVEALAGARKQLGRNVDPTLYSPREYRARIRSGDFLLKSVLSEPVIWVVGGPNDLGRLRRSPDAERNKSSRKPRRPRGP